MKQRFNKPTVLLLSLWLSTTAYAATDDVADALEYSKSDAILADKVYYQIGGGAGYMAPPSRGSTNVVNLGLGWKANLTCGNFDIKTTIKNDLNGLQDGFKDLMGNIIESAQGAVASMPAMILQRANPQLYDLITNGVYQGKLDFANLKTNCQEMSKQLADYTLGGKLSQAADTESYKDITAKQPDAKQAQKDLENKKGKEGIPWVGGEKKGGQNQDPINVVGDVIKSGYNQLNKRDVLDKSKVSSNDCDGELCKTWDTPQAASDFLTRVIGEKSITTCQEDCGTSTGAKAGVGLAPIIEEEHVATVVKLQEVLNMDSPTAEVLATLGSDSLPVTRGLIEALREDPDVDILANRLAGEVATTKVMKKMLLSRRAVLAGMLEPNVANNAMLQAELERVLSIIDREIAQVKLEDEMRKSTTNNTAVAILQNKIERDRKTGSKTNSKDSLDKRINDLNYGAPATEEENEEISVPRKTITLSLPSTSNVAPYIPSITNATSIASGASSSSGTSSYSSIGAISGSAATQATALLKKFEGFSATPYDDVNALRAGYGSDTVTYADGTVAKITAGMTVSREDAERDLARRSQEFASLAQSQVSTTTWNSLPASAQAVLTSYVYNYGSLNKTPSVIRAAQASAQSGDMTALATAIRNRQVDNDGVNAKRRNQEADYILNNSGS